MAKLFGRAGFIAGALALVFIVAMAVPAAAQQGAPVNPTAAAVKEQQLLNELGRIQGRTSIPDVKSNVLEQPAGREWRHFHEVTLRWIGAIAVLGMLAILVIFYLSRGMVKLESGPNQLEIVEFLAKHDIAVCAHLGLKPQSVHKTGGFRVQGREEDAARRMLASAQALKTLRGETLSSALDSRWNWPVIGSRSRDCTVSVMATPMM